MKKTTLTLSISLLLIMSLSMSTVFAAPPPITNGSELYIATLEGGVPETVDPAWSYDTASAEIIFNVYDTLLVFYGEHMEEFSPSLATSWEIVEISETSPEGIDWYYRYIFEIRAGVTFHDGHALTPEDIEYSIERGMIQDRDGGPQWMFYEPLFNGWGLWGFDVGYGGPLNFSVPADIVTMGQILDHAVESNATHVWFNLGFPGSYAPFLQILCQGWACILSKDWINDYVIGTLSRSDWPGEWGDYSESYWFVYNNPPTSPLDDPTNIMMGCGPFEYDTLDHTASYWTVTRYVDYWRGWPADYPELSGSVPAGYVERVTVTWAFTWEVRSTMFLAGDVDMCAVPRMYMDVVNDQDGIRLIFPLPSLAVGVLHYNFDIDPTSPYGNILSPGTFDENGIPSDFYGNPTWGIHVRKAFSYLLDYDTFLSVALQGEAIQPPTALIPTLPYYNASIPKYTYDLAKAETEFKSVPGLWDTGFSIQILYNTGNLVRQTAANLLKEGIDNLNNSKFHVETLGLAWGTVLLPAIIAGQVTTFVIGWLADYPDPHNFAYPYYYSYGTYAHWQAYSNPTMDALIEAGIAALEPDRAAIYSAIQQLAIDDCPSVGLYSAIGRHYERDWVCGWYYNPIYPGQYAYNLWKWYYVEGSLYDTAEQPISGYLPVDINYDGKVDMKDIGTCAKGFGANYGPPLHPRWVFRCDFNNDRKIDMKDIGRVAKNFGKTSAVWVAPP